MVPLAGLGRDTDSHQSLRSDDDFASSHETSGPWTRSRAMEKNELFLYRWTRRGWDYIIKCLVPCPMSITTGSLHLVFIYRFLLIQRQAAQSRILYAPY
jgi:hypothetical protein